MFLPLLLTSTSSTCLLHSDRTPLLEFKEKFGQIADLVHAVAALELIFLTVGALRVLAQRRRQPINMALPSLPEQKVAEKLTILNERGSQLLHRLYNLKKV